MNCVIFCTSSVSDNIAKFKFLHEWGTHVHSVTEQVATHCYIIIFCTMSNTLALLLLCL